MPGSRGDGISISMRCDDAVLLKSLEEGETEESNCLPATPGTNQQIGLESIFDTSGEGICLHDSADPDGRLHYFSLKTINPGIRARDQLL